MTPNLVLLSHAAVGTYAAATYGFFTKGYKPPARPRDMDSDVVHNANGKFKYVYDNGPGFRRWEPFTIRCDDEFSGILAGNGATQYSRLLELWDFPANLVLKAPEGVYNVHWAVDNSMEQAFIVFPRQTGDILEYDVDVQFEEA